jgi:hypothetical protein
MKGEGRNLKRRKRLRNIPMKVLMIPKEGSQKVRKETRRRRKWLKCLMILLFLMMMLVLLLALMSVIMTHYKEHCRSQISRQNRNLQQDKLKEEKLNMTSDSPSQKGLYSW